MGRPKAPEWTPAELAVLHELYPSGGYQAVVAVLPNRTWRAVYVMASKVGLRSAMKAPARKLNLEGADLARAVELREQHGWSFARIGAEFGICETAASNAIHITLCEARGHRPAARDPFGKLLPEEKERMRYMLKKGLRAVDIQRRMAVSAATVSQERRLYNAELAARGKALLPPPGNGERYCGARLLPEMKKEVERLLLTGMGTPKVAEATGAGKTQVVRMRRVLVARLKGQGKALPGCDIDGNRITVFGSRREIPEETKERFRALILARLPVQRAAKKCGIGQCSAYRLRDELRADLERRGEALPTPKLPGKMKAASRRLLAEEGMPAAHKFRLRKLIHDMGETAARAEFARQLRAEAVQPSTFEQQLARVAAGASLVPSFRPSKVLPQITLGGVATGAL